MCDRFPHSCLDGSGEYDGRGRTWRPLDSCPGWVGSDGNGCGWVRTVDPRTSDPTDRVTVEATVSTYGGSPDSRSDNCNDGVGYGVHDGSRDSWTDGLDGVGDGRELGRCTSCGGSADS